MKNNYELDQLLNDYIDEKLTLREQNEVKRLVDNDSRVAQRLNELQKCKLLLESLPVEKAPAGILNNVMAQLTAPVQDEPEVVYRPKRQLFGIVQLFLRKSLAAAALLLLVCGLVVMIYYIVSPPPQKPNIAGNPKTGIENPIVTNWQETHPVTTPVFAARLELKAKTQGAPAAVVKFLEDNFASAVSALPGQSQKPAYVVNCTGEKIASLSDGLQNLWNDFASARLVVDTNSPGRVIVVDNIKPNQFVEILSQNNLDLQFKAAQYFAFMNNINRTTNTTSIIPGIPSNPNDIPRPRLAQKENQNPLTPPPVLHLTIEISPE